ncbi:hypothetical protein [Chitinivibrio alkaliphilus]|nr:hypothetical protein [Chitinivibrio alkaliphilus]
MNKGIFLLIVLPLWLFGGDLFTPFSDEIEEALHATDDTRAGRVVETRPETFFSYSFRTIAAPRDTVLAHVEAYHTYDTLFSWLKRCIALEEEPPLYFFELGKLFFRYWSIIEKVDRHETEYVAITFRQNRDEHLNDLWREEEEGLVTVENKEFQLRWIIDSRGTDHTRLGLVLYAVPDTRIPRWLTRMAMRIAVPACTEDIAQAVQK